MNTKEEIELHELQAIELRLSTEPALGGASQDAAARGIPARSEVGFEMA